MVDLSPGDDVPTRLLKYHETHGTLMRETLVPKGVNIQKNPGCGQCVALRGQVGKKVSCSIYARRPKVCREFEVGGYDCREARARAGIENPDVVSHEA